MYSKDTTQLNQTQKLSIWLSSLCLIHCLITPFIILLLPSLGAFFSGWVEIALVASILPISSVAFFPIWVKHKNSARIIEYLIGISLVISAQVIVFFHGHGGNSIEQYAELSLMIIGTLLIAYSTYRNRRHTHHCHTPGHVHE